MNHITMSTAKRLLNCMLAHGIAEQCSDDSVTLKGAGGANYSDVHEAAANLASGRHAHLYLGRPWAQGVKLCQTQFTERPWGGRLEATDSHLRRPPVRPKPMAAPVPPTTEQLADAVVRAMGLPQG